MIRKTLMACVGAALAAALAAPATGQVVRGGTSGSVNGNDISVGSSGYGSTDGSFINVGGTADAEARDGGVVRTRVRGRTGPVIGQLRSFGSARDEDERAFSRTRTVVRNGETVRSRTHNMYRQRGSPPVHEFIRDDQSSRRSHRRD
jgi:hypothetical protein